MINYNSSGFLNFSSNSQGNPNSDRQPNPYITPTAAPGNLKRKNETAPAPTTEPKRGRFDPAVTDQTAQQVLDNEKKRKAINLNEKPSDQTNKKRKVVPRAQPLTVRIAPGLSINIPKRQLVINGEHYYSIDDVALDLFKNPSAPGVEHKLVMMLLNRHPLTALSLFAFGFSTFQSVLKDHRRLRPIEKHVESCNWLKGEILALRRNGVTNDTYKINCTDILPLIESHTLPKLFMAEGGKLVLEYNGKREVQSSAEDNTLLELATYLSFNEYRYKDCFDPVKAFGVLTNVSPLFLLLCNNDIGIFRSRIDRHGNIGSQNGVTFLKERIDELKSTLDSVSKHFGFSLENCDAIMRELQEKHRLLTIANTMPLVLDDTAAEMTLVTTQDRSRRVFPRKNFEESYKIFKRCMDLYRSGTTPNIVAELSLMSSFTHIGTPSDPCFVSPYYLFFLTPEGDQCLLKMIEDKSVPVKNRAMFLRQVFQDLHASRGVGEIRDSSQYQNILHRAREELEQIERGMAPVSQFPSSQPLQAVGSTLPPEAIAAMSQAVMKQPEKAQFVQFSCSKHYLVLMNQATHSGFSAPLNGVAVLVNKIIQEFARNPLFRADFRELYDSQGFKELLIITGQSNVGISPEILFLLTQNGSHLLVQWAQYKLKRDGSQLLGQWTQYKLNSEKLMQDVVAQKKDLLGLLRAENEKLKALFSLDHDLIGFQEAIAEIERMPVLLHDVPQKPATHSQFPVQVAGSTLPPEAIAAMTQAVMKQQEKAQSVQFSCTQKHLVLMNQATHTRVYTPLNNTIVLVNKIIQEFARNPYIAVDFRELYDSKSYKEPLIVTDQSNVSVSPEILFLLTQNGSHLLVQWAKYKLKRAEELIQDVVAQKRDLLGLLRAENEKLKALFSLNHDLIGFQEAIAVIERIPITLHAVPQKPVTHSQLPSSRGQTMAPSTQAQAKDVVKFLCSNTHFILVNQATKRGFSTPLNSHVERFHKIAQEFSHSGYARADFKELYDSKSFNEPFTLKAGQSTVSIFPEILFLLTQNGGKLLVQWAQYKLQRASASGENAIAQKDALIEQLRSDNEKIKALFSLNHDPIGFQAAIAEIEQIPTTIHAVAHEQQVTQPVAKPPIQPTRSPMSFTYDGRILTFKNHVTSETFGFRVPDTARQSIHAVQKIEFTLRKNSASLIDFKELNQNSNLFPLWNDCTINPQVLLLFLDNGDQLYSQWLGNPRDASKNDVIEYLKSIHEKFQERFHVALPNIRSVVEQLGGKIEEKPVAVPVAKSAQPLPTLNSVGFKSIREIARSKSKENQEIKSAYLAFFKKFKKYVTHPTVGQGLRGLLLKERGFFGFTGNKTGAGTLDIIGQIYGEVLNKSPIPVEAKLAILNDAINFLNINDNNETLEQQKSLICKDKTLLDLETSQNILESLLTIKLSEYKQTIIDLFKGEIREKQERVLPCYFVQDDNGKPVLKMLNAHFDQQGHLRGIFADNGSAKDYLSSLGIVEGSSVLDHVERLKGILQTVKSDNDLSFILLDETMRAKALPSSEGNPRPPKKGDGQKVAKTKGKGTRKIVVEKDADLLNDIPEIGSGKKRKTKSSLPLAKLRKAEQESTYGFWQQLSLSQCEKIQNRSRPLKSSSLKMEALTWNIPDLNIEETVRTLHMLQAMSYQVDGIDRLSALNDMGVAGILGWWMGLGKTLASEELIMRLLAKGEGKSTLVTLPNAVLPQFMQELKERLMKGQFACLLGSAFHLDTCDERKVRLEKIKQFFHGSFDGILQGTKFKLTFSASSGNMQRMQEALILLAAMPNGNDKAVLASRLELDHDNMKKNLKNILRACVEKMVASRNQEDNAELAKKIIECLKSYNIQVKESDDCIELLDGINLVIDKKPEGVPKEKEGRFLAELVGQLLMLDPSYPYLKAKQDNYPGKNGAEFKNIMDFDCNEQIRCYKDGVLSGKPCVYFWAYHEVGVAKEQDLSKCAETANIGLVISDEVHTMAENGKRKSSIKNSNMKKLIPAIRANNKNCQLVPCSGTFVRGDLAELLELLALFNPEMIPESLREELIKLFNSAVTSFNALTKKSLEDSEKEIEQIVNSYANLIVLNYLLNKITAKAHPKDKNVGKDWNDRIPTKDTKRVSETLEKLGICEEVRREVNHCNMRFKQSGDIGKIQKDLENALLYPGLKTTPLETVLQNIALGKTDKDIMQQEVAKSYRFSSMLQTSLTSDIKAKKKIIVVIDHLKTAAIIKAYLESYYADEKLNVGVYNGDVKKATGRQEIIDTFKKDNSQAQVLLLSRHIGAVGLNLQEVDTQIMLESGYDPYQRKQAKGRGVRCGSKKFIQIYALDELEKHFDVERNRRHILLMKKRIAKFFTQNFQGHESHFPLFLKALKMCVLNQYYKEKRDLKDFDIDKIMEALHNKMQTYISSPEFAKVCDSVNPFLAPPKPRIDVCDKGKEKVKEPETDWDDEMAQALAFEFEMDIMAQGNEDVAITIQPLMDSELDIEIPQFEMKIIEDAPVTEKEKGVEAVRETQPVQELEYQRYGINEIISIPLQDATFERALSAACFICDTLKDPNLVRDLYAANDAAVDGQIRNAIRQDGAAAVRGSKIEGLYNAFDKALSKKKPVDRNAHIYTFKDGYYILSDSKVVVASDKKPVMLRAVTGFDNKYDIIFPKNLIPKRQ